MLMRRLRTHGLAVHVKFGLGLEVEFVARVEAVSVREEGWLGTYAPLVINTVCHWLLHSPRCPLVSFLGRHRTHFIYFLQ